MTPVGFEPTIQVCEWAKTFHALDRVAIADGCYIKYSYPWREKFQLCTVNVSGLLGCVASSLMRELCYPSLFYSKAVQIGCLIYHRPSPKKDPRGNRQRNSSSTSFQDFQDSVSDAWDIGDDEFCIISGRRSYSLKGMQE